MRLDCLAILPEKKKKSPNQRTTDINKSLPVRYFTLARALSSASKYHTVIAYLGKGFKKKFKKFLSLKEKHYSETLNIKLNETILLQFSRRNLS